jgi:hypothetical protein
MNTILEIAASNAVFSAFLAIVTIAVTRVWRSPQLAHGLWLLVLLKLVTPPLISVSANQLERLVLAATEFDGLGSPSYSCSITSVNEAPARALLNAVRKATAKARRKEA